MFWLLLRIYRMRSLTKLKYLVSGYLLSEMNTCGDYMLIRGMGPV